MNKYLILVFIILIFIFFIKTENFDNECPQGSIYNPTTDKCVCYDRNATIRNINGLNICTCNQPFVQNHMNNCECPFDNSDCVPFYDKKN